MSATSTSSVNRPLSREADAENQAHWFLPILMAIEATFVGNTFGTLAPAFGVLLVCGVATVFVAQRTRRLTATSEQIPLDSHNAVYVSRAASTKKRWLLVTCLMMLCFVVSLAWRVTDYLGNNFNPVALFVDSAAHTALLVSLVLWTLYPRRGHPAMLGSGVSVVMLSVAAGGVSQGIASQVAVGLAMFAVFAFSSRWLGLRWHSDSESQGAVLTDDQDETPSPLLGQSDSMVRTEADRSRTGLLYSVLALSAILMTTSLIAQVTAAWLPDVQGRLYRSLQSQLEAISDRSLLGGGKYVRGSKLGTLRNHMLSAPNEITLHAYAETEPGYLRGTVFDFYSDGKWFASHEGTVAGYEDVEEIQSRRLQASAMGTAALNENSSGSRLARFPLVQRGSPSVGQIEIHNRPHKGPLVFTPLNAQWLEAASSAIAVNQYGIVEGGVDLFSPYVVDVGVRSEPKSLRPLQEEILLTVSSEIRAKLQPLAIKLTRTRSTPRAKARAIQDHFQDNFTYSLRDSDSPEGVDPIVNFLDTEHPAHCEYFASAAAMLLRCVNIPTRYVTGYVVSEYNDESERWLGKNRDAHAWVEAYDDITEEWFPVEATVGRNYITLQSLGASDFLQRSSDSDGSFDDESTSIFGRAFGWLFSLRATDPLILLFRLAQAPLFCGVLLLLWYRYRRRGDRGDPDEIRSRKLLHRVDRKLKKQNLVRAPHETLHQFARRVDQAAETDSDQPSIMLQRAASWYREFAEARYQGQRPTEFDFSVGT